MNVVKLMGGLGNQLFQYAFGQAQMNVGFNVKYDIAWYEKAQIDREYVLYKFRVNPNISICNVRNKPIYEKNHPHFYNNIILDNCNFIGYWQSPKYFRNITEQLKKEFCVRGSYYTKNFLQIQEQIRSTNSVSIHIRRGDFLQHHSHLVMNMEYYLSAMKIMETLRNDIQYFVFTDDMAWAKSNFTNVNFVELNDPCLELELMKQCKNNIICNSTFSWWAAFLNQNKYKLVITPKRWWRDDSAQDFLEEKEFLLDDWIKI